MALIIPMVLVAMAVAAVVGAHPRRNRLTASVPPQSDEQLKANLHAVGRRLRDKLDTLGANH